MRHLLERCYTVLGGELYLVLDGSRIIPGKAVVLDDGGGYLYHLLQIGNTADTRLGTLFQILYPIVLRYAVRDNLIETVGELVAGNGYSLGEFRHLRLEIGKVLATFARHRVGSSHSATEGTALFCQRVQGTDNAVGRTRYILEGESQVIELFQHPLHGAVHRLHHIPQILYVSGGGNKLFLAVNIQFYTKSDTFCHILFEIRNLLSIFAA